MTQTTLELCSRRGSLPGRREVHRSGTARRRATRRNLLITLPKFVAVETSMLGMQFDPTLGLSLSRQRNADLIAEAHQQQLVQEALDYAPRRTQPPEQAARGRVASRRTGLVLASLLRTMSFAVRGL